MTVAEELYLLGVPENECGPLAKKLIDAAAVSGYSNALDGIMYAVRFLLQKPAPTLNDAAIRALDTYSKS